MKKCPFCAEEIHNNVTVCEFCREKIDDTQTQKEDLYDSHGDFFTAFFKAINRSYVRAVIVNIIELLVIIGVYNYIYDSFEIIVVSILIITYLSIRTIVSGRALQKPVENLAILGEFRKIRFLINARKSEDDEIEEDEIMEAKIKLKKQQIKLYINIAFYFIAYAIAVIKLIQQILN